MRKHKMTESTSERLPSTWKMSADTQSGWTAATMHFFAVLCKTTMWNDQVPRRLRNVDDDG